MSRRRVQGDERIVQSRGRAPQAADQTGDPQGQTSGLRAAEPTGQPLNLRHAEFDQERLARQTYLTIPELTAYGRFESENATWLWLGRNPHKVPKCRRGRSVTILRRDYDRAVQPTRMKSVEAERHAS